MATTTLGPEHMSTRRVVAVAGPRERAVEVGGAQGSASPAIEGRTACILPHPQGAQTGRPTLVPTPGHALHPLHAVGAQGTAASAYVAPKRTAHAEVKSPDAEADTAKHTGCPSAADGMWTAESCLYDPEATTATGGEPPTLSRPSTYLTISSDVGLQPGGRRTAS